MATVFRPRTLVLFLGDIVFFVLALWVSLYLRVLQVPSLKTFEQHMVPFSLLFIAWVIVFFIAGLYESRLMIFARRALSATLLVAQVINMVIAALFFFFIPLFGIAPKTLLVIYLIVSFVLVLCWRAFLFPWLGLAKPEASVLIGEGAEIDELARALRGAPRAPVRIVEVISPRAPELTRTVVAAMERHRARVVIADFDDPLAAAAFPQMYNLLSVGVRFIDALTLYEDLFGRVPLSRLDSAWLARNINAHAHLLYDPLKRAMDVVIALSAGIVSLVFYPFIIAAIKLDDGGPIFIAQKRVGRGDRIMYIHKFRSMQRNDIELTTQASDNKITRVGSLTRKTRLDELPQLWDIVRGELSFVGPRPELPAGVALYEKEIPYYGLRHLVKPGLSGWAQLYHHADAHHATDVLETRNKLSYDLYYLKHRSLLLDLVVALKTIRRILIRGNA